MLCRSVTIIILSLYLLSGVSLAESFSISPEDGTQNSLAQIQNSTWETNSGETYTISSTGSSSDQNIINAVIDQAYNAGGGTIRLTSGVYWVSDTVIMKSNVKLTGDPDAIIKVYPSNSQWYTGSIGIISCQGTIHNAEICGFQINGNLGSLDSNLANTPGHDKDCERCIILHGDSGNYAYNIKIHDMKLYDSFSDGMYIYYAQNIQCYNNFISNTQHEGIFWSVVLNSEMYGNKIAGITSDCLRLDNCVNCKVIDNILFSYDGTNTNGAYKHGENGLQVGNAGSSHGYDASNKPTKTTNIEITNNTFANNGLQAILMGSGSDNNVYVHDNKFIGRAELETMGIPVEISQTNQPTKERSEKIFTSILDIFKIDAFIHVGKNDTVVLPEGMKESNGKAIGTIEYQTIGNNTTTLVKIPKNYLEGVSEVRYNVKGETATHTLLIGELTSHGYIFTVSNVWNGDLDHSRDALKLSGRIEPKDINVECITPTDTFLPIFEVTEYKFEPFRIHPGIYILIVIVFFGYVIIRFELRHMA